MNISVGFCYNVCTDSGSLRFLRHKLRHLTGAVTLWPQLSPLTITAIVTKATAKMLVSTMAMVTLEMATMGLVIQAIVIPAMTIAAMATLVTVITVMDTMVTDTTAMNSTQMVTLHADACFPQLP